MPAGASSIQFAHYGQHINSGKFTKFDFGSKNIYFYGRSTPPEYNLTRVDVPIAMHYGDNDALSRPSDIMLLKNYFPNIIGWYRCPNPKFSHFDFMFGTDARKLVYVKVLQIANKYM